jgi:hypothetical protein
VVWNEAGLKPRDADFQRGRALNRQAIYETLDLPLGYMSEASTEAHARVAERRFLHSVYRRHVRVAAKLNMDAMRFWSPGFLASFPDVRRESADWEQLSKRIAAEAKYKTLNELRADQGLPPLGGYDVLEADRREAANWRDTRPVQSSGQVQNVLESGE